MTYAQSRRNVCSVEITLTEQERLIVERLLMCRRDQFVSHEELIEYVWPDPWRQPDSARSQLHVVASRMRLTKGVQIVNHWGWGFSLGSAR